MDLARDLIRQKIDGQRANLVRLQASDLRGFDAMREALDPADTIDEIHLCEAKAATPRSHVDDARGSFLEDGYPKSF